MHGLALDQAPPYSVPMRHFLAAPLFALAAALLLLWSGPAIFAEPRGPAAVALTHLLTLGFATLVMMGALTQMLPVVAGAPLRAPRLLAAFTYPALILAVPGIAVSLLAAPHHLAPFAVLAAAALVLFATMALAKLACSSVRNATVAGMGLACTALLAAVALGLGASLMRAGLLPPRTAAAELHLQWALAGWVGLLVVGVAFQVVPMFQMTPSYPAWVRRGVPAALLLGLLLATAGVWIGPLALLVPGGGLLSAAALGLFAVTTLSLQARRRRPADVTLAYWRLGMASLLACSLLWAAMLLRPDLAIRPGAAALLGILALVGAVQSVITGMLYKIVPFLTWFHLNAMGVRGLSNMHEILPQGPARRQYRLHLAALALLLLAPALPLLTRPAALVYGAAALLLAINLWRAAALYRHGSRLARQHRASTAPMRPPPQS